MEECKSCENDYIKFSSYVHGYWIPYLKQQLEKNPPKKGKAASLANQNFCIGNLEFQNGGFEVRYEGQVDENGKAFGYGTAINDRCNLSWTGTFKDNQLHGIGW